MAEAEDDISNIVRLAEINRRGKGGIDSAVVAARETLLQSSATFTANYVPPDYLIDGFLQRRYVYSFTARTGEGKTAISLLLMAHIAMGKSLAGREIIPGRCLMLAGENPDDVCARWIAMGQQMDFDLNTIDVHFIPGTFSIPELLPRIQEEVTALGPIDLLVVDTSAVYFEGENENDNVEAGKHAAMLRNLISLPGGPCIIVNCHPTKRAPDDDIIPRGGGAFLAAVDGNLCAKKDGLTIELSCQGKFRGPEFSPINFGLRSVTHERLKDSRGRLIKTVIAEPLSDQAKEDMDKAARGEEDRMLLALENNSGASMTDLADTLGWTLPTRDAGKSRAKRVVGKLLRARLVEKERGEIIFTNKGSKALKRLKKDSD
jgi:DNA-binding MarR family transcriptional regulator